MSSKSLQVPKSKRICSQKKYYDILYSYFQCISVWDPKLNIRSFSKKEVNYSKLAKVFNLSRQTVSTKFKNLKELGLIKDLDENNYELIELEDKEAVLIPYETLKILTDALSENAISTYAWLFNENWKNIRQNQEKGIKEDCIFTLEQIKLHIGICHTTRSNDNIITNILFVLQKLGLISYSLTSMKQEKDSFSNIKTVYKLNWVKRDIK